MIIFGTRTRELGGWEIPGHSCSDSRNTLLAQVTTSYLHIFWIPVFPYAKTVYTVCTHCQQSLAKSQLPPDLKTAATQAARFITTPWYYFAGLLLLCAVLLLPTVLTAVASIFAYFS